MAPFDVRLFYEEDNSDKLVVQPDVLVICDSKKLSDGRACRGAPDFVVEVVSDGSTKKDFVTKKAKYEKAGVDILPGCDISFREMGTADSFNKSCPLLETEPRP